MLPVIIKLARILLQRQPYLQKGYSNCHYNQHDLINH